MVAGSIAGWREVEFELLERLLSATSLPVTNCTSREMLCICLASWPLVSSTSYASSEARSTSCGRAIAAEEIRPAKSLHCCRQRRHLSASANCSPTTRLAWRSFSSIYGEMLNSAVLSGAGASTEAEAKDGALCSTAREVPDLDRG